MTRRVFAALVAGSLALALGACGGSSEPAPAESAPAESAEQSEASAEQQAEEPAEEEASSNIPFVVTIDGVRLAKDYEDKDAAIVTFSFTNNSEETTSFMAAVYPKVFQNGIQCETAFVYEGIENDNYMTDIRPGTTIQVDMAYEISDTSDIEVEVEELFSFSDEKIAEAVLSLS